MPVSKNNQGLLVFSSEEQNIKSNLVRISSTALFLGAIAGIILFIIEGSTNLVLAFSFMLIGSVISLLLLHYFHLRPASWTLLIWMLASLLLIIYSADGVHDTMMLLFPLSILIASMLLDKRDIIVYSFVIFLSMQLFIFCEIVGIIDNPMSNFTSLMDMISVGILMFFTIVITYKMADSVNRSFLLVEQNNLSLYDINLKLQNEILERNGMELKIKSKITELEQYKKATVNRELRMVELKNELITLKEKVPGVGTIAD